jgi:molecular chaperone DnaJ
LILNIPAGVNNGDTMVQAGGGHAIRNGVPGDLHIIMRHLPHKDFVKIGNDLRYIKKLSYYEVILGVSIEVPTIEGGKIKLDVPEFSNNSTTLRLKEKGMNVMNESFRGDLLVQIEVEFPKEIIDEERELLEKIKEIKEKVEKPE